MYMYVCVDYVEVYYVLYMSSSLFLHSFLYYLISFCFKDVLIWAPNISVHLMLNTFCQGRTYVYQKAVFVSPDSSINIISYLIIHLKSFLFTLSHQFPYMSRGEKQLELRNYYLIESLDTAYKAKMP